MLLSGNGRRSASAHTEKSTDVRLADASSRAKSRPIVVMSTPDRRASSLARQGMSPSPVPTSSSVASRGTSFNASLTSSRAELIPPNRALARATSASERVTIRGSTSGESSISTPLLRGGVSMSRTALMLQLCVTAAVVEERRPALHARRFHFAEDDSVVASIVQGEPAALQHPEHVVENRVSIRRPREADAFEPVYVGDRKAAGDLLLSGRQNVDGESRRRSERLVRRGGLLDADEDKRRLQAHRAECAHGHSLIGSVSAFGSHYRHTGRKPAEYRAKLVWVDAQVLNAGEMKRLKRKRGLSTTLGGMKSPATPTSKSAMSLRRERIFAALFRKYGYAMAMPTIRSTFHLPPNSLLRALSYPERIRPSSFALRPSASTR